MKIHSKHDFASRGKTRCLAVLIVAIVILCAFSSCQTTTVVFNENEPLPMPEQLNVQQRYSSLALGIIELSDPQTTTCPPEKNVSRVVVHRGFIDLLIHASIGGIYTTRTIEVYCKP